MKYRLVLKDEGGRERVFDTLDQISSEIEGIDWMSGDYEVHDDDGLEYEAEWITRPSVRRTLLFFRSVDIGSYKLVPKSTSAQPGTAADLTTRRPGG
jgi:hypothetical protein